MSELKPCEAIEILKDIYPSKKQIVTGEYTEVAEALDMAIAALRRAQPANEPLALEQLREMDGEPVWCVDCFGNQCWALVNVADDDCIDKETGAWNMGLYGVSDKPVDLTGWLAYRRPPEGSENDG